MSSVSNEVVPLPPDSERGRRLRAMFLHVNIGQDLRVHRRSSSEPGPWPYIGRDDGVKLVYHGTIIRALHADDSDGSVSPSRPARPANGRTGRARRDRWDSPTLLHPPWKAS